MRIFTSQKSRYKKTQAKKAFIFLAPSLTGVLLFVLIPFADAFRRAFYESMSGKFTGLDNYKSVLQNDAFRLAAKNSGKFLAVCIPLLLFFSFIFSLLLINLKKNSFIKTVFLIPVAIPTASVVLLWKVFFHKYGLINTIVTWLGGNVVDFMNTGSAFQVLVFSYIWRNTGYNMILWLAGLSDIPYSLYEAAKMDGAGAYARLWYITLPELLPAIYVTVVLSIVNSFKVFREAYLIAGNYPDESIYMLQHIFNNWFLTLDLQKMCAAAVMMAAAILLFIKLLQKIDKRW